MYEPLVSGGTYAESRRNRFGGAVSDEYIRRYADPSALHDAVRGRGRAAASDRRCSNACCSWRATGESSRAPDAR
jgi:hypothetical protein